MMKEGKHQGIGKKPPEAHNTQGWFGFIIKPIFLYGDTDKQDTHQRQHYTRGRVKTWRIVKSING